MKKKYAAIAVILCSALALYGCGGKEKEADPAVAEVVEASAPVEVWKVDKSSIENGYLYSGKVKPINEINVLSTVAGKVATVNYDVGDYVKAGSVLFTMDTTDITNSINVQQAAVREADASINSAKTNVELANGASMQSQIEASKTALSNAELAYNNAKTTYENNKTLFESNVISKTAFDQSESAFQQAEISYNQAKESYDIVANQMPAENLRRAQDSLKVAEASKAASQAQIASFQKSLKDSTVTSPISGYVTACNVKPATLLSQQAVPFTIIDTSVVNIDVSVSEQIINSLSAGQEVSVKIATVADVPFKGVIGSVNPAATSAGTYDVKIEIPNGDGKLKSGMFGEVTFTREKSENTIVLPRNAVVTKNNESSVFIEENGVAKKVIVTTGVDNGDEIEVLSGVELGMNVIIKGQTYLADGDKVQIITNSTTTDDKDSADSSKTLDAKEE